MRALRLSLLAAVVAVSLASCANNPGLKKSQKITSENIEQVVSDRSGEMKRTWERTDPAISYFDRDKSLFIERQDEIPASIAGIVLSDMRVVDGTPLSHLNGYFRSLGVNLVFGVDQMAQPPSKTDKKTDIKDIEVGISGYSGTLGDFLEIMERTYNVSFSYVGNNTIKVSRYSNYVASVPQNDQVVKAIQKNLEALGAQDVVVDQLTGSVIYNATNQDQHRIARFVDRFFENYAGIKMQMTIFVVSMNEDASDGFNWGELDVVLGHVQAAHAGTVVDKFLNNLGSNTGTGTGTGTGTSTGTGTGTGTSTGTGAGTGTSTGTTNGNNPNFGYNTRYAGSSIDDLRGYSWLNKDKLKLGAFNNNISVSVATDWLNQYGSTRAEQSAFLETITGKETIIESQRKIPYAGAESTSLVGSQNPIATQNSTIEEKIQGIKVKFVPYYDSSSQEVMIDLDINLNSYVGTTQVTAPSGNISNIPDIQEEKFPTTARMKVGETKLLGGIKFSSLTDDRSSINVMRLKDTDYINQKLTKSAMFILLRTTVELFRPDEFGAKKTADAEEWVDVVEPSVDVAPAQKEQME